MRERQLCEEDRASSRWGYSGLPSLVPSGPFAGQPRYTQFSEKGRVVRRGQRCALATTPDKLVALARRGRWVALGGVGSLSVLRSLSSVVVVSLRWLVHKLVRSGTRPASAARFRSAWGLH